MNWRNSLKRFDFNHEPILNHQVGTARVSNQYPVEHNRNCFLPFNFEAGLKKGRGHDRFIDVLEQPWSEFFVNSKPAVDRLSR